MFTLNKKASLQTSAAKGFKLASKQKSISKAERKQAEGKLQKHSSSSKLDRKQRNVQNADNLQEQEQVQKAFSLHRRTVIGKNEALQSLKYLGYSCYNPIHYQSFQKIWATHHKDLVDILTFKDIYTQLQDQKQIQSFSQQFSLLSKGEPNLDFYCLTNAKEGARCEGNIALILSQCGTEGLISYQQFSRIMHTLNTQT